MAPAGNFNFVAMSTDGKDVLMEGNFVNVTEITEDHTVTITISLPGSLETHDKTVSSITNPWNVAFEGIGPPYGLRQRVAVAGVITHTKTGIEEFVFVWTDTFELVSIASIIASQDETINIPDGDLVGDALGLPDVQ